MASTIPVEIVVDQIDGLQQLMDENQRAVRFDVYEVYDTVGKTHMEKDTGRITPYSITHRFAHPVPKGTPVKLRTTLTEDGVLTADVEDFQTEKRTTSKCFTMHNTLSD